MYARVASAERRKKKSVDAKNASPARHYRCCWLKSFAPFYDRLILFCASSRYFLRNFFGGYDKMENRARCMMMIRMISHCVLSVDRLEKRQVNSSVPFFNYLVQSFLNLAIASEVVAVNVKKNFCF